MRPFTPRPLTYFYMSRPAPCPYLPGRLEQMVFTDLSASNHPDAFHDQLSRAGFRRSQGIAYKPCCQGCNACVPVRIRVADFSPNRSMRRVWQRNRRVRGRELPPLALSEHFELFRRYLDHRHAEGGMSAMTFEDYVSMIQDSPVLTRVVEFREPDNTLYGTCLTDVLDDGLSLVYSFFEPEHQVDSPGTYIILWHIKQARKLGLPYVYLGYWIQDSAKMAYKARFRPIEGLGPEGWHVLPPG